MKAYYNRIKSTSCLFLLLTSGLAHSANIIFDLGDVLIETRYFKTVFNIGPARMVSYALTLQNPFAVHKKLFQFLDHIKPQDPKQFPVRDHYGTLLPQLMCDWLSGTINPTDLLQLIENNLDAIPNWQERVLIHSLARTIFIPDVFTPTRYIVPAGIAFVQACKAAGHSIYILSNWDPDSFTQLQEKCPEFFNLFDGIIISGDVGFLKPDPRIFYYLLERYNLKATDCYFIDDLPDNVKAAKKLGINALLYKNRPSLLFHSPNFKAIADAINAQEELKDSPIFIDYNGY